MRRAIQRRLVERSELIETARSYVRVKAAQLSIRSAHLVGSVARGDFNQWSDIDVVIVADELPEHFLDRSDLFSDRPPGLEVFAYTPDELQNEAARKNPIVLETGSVGIDLLSGQA